MRSLALAPVVLALLAVTGCSAGGPSGGAPGGYSTCAEIEEALVPSLESQFDNATVSEIDATTASTPPGVTLPPADCAWAQVVPAGSSDGNGLTADDVTNVFAFYLQDGVDLIADFDAQVSAAGCYNSTPDEPVEWFCGNPDELEGWVVSYATYSFTLPVEATEITVQLAVRSA